MTQKELLYVEDVLSHTQDLEKICNNFSNRVEDDIKNFITYVEDKSHTIFNDFYNLLNL